MRLLKSEASCVGCAEDTQDQQQQTTKEQQEMMEAGEAAADEYKQARSEAAAAAKHAHFARRQVRCNHMLVQCKPAYSWDAHKIEQSLMYSFG